MPGNVAAAVATTVFPQSLSTAFSETFIFPLLIQEYHDNNVERGIIQDGVNTPVPIRGWRKSKRLNATDFATLKTFFEARGGGLEAFIYYDPFAADPPGSNYDPTGVEVVGKCTCVFRGNWADASNIGRSEAGLEIAQVA